MHPYIHHYYRYLGPLGSCFAADIPSGWHIEARGLSTGRIYSLTSQHSLSQHSHSLDASQCSAGPKALQPGSLWSVITASEPYKDMNLYAQLVVQVSRVWVWAARGGGVGGLLEWPVGGGGGHQCCLHAVGYVPNAAWWGSFVYTS